MKWLALVVLAACSGQAAGGSVDGSKIFQSVCAACHGPAGKPPEAMVAAYGVRDLTTTAFRARVTPELVEAQVRSGSKSKVMPSFEGALSDAQIKAVAAYVANPSFPRAR